MSSTIQNLIVVAVLGGLVFLGYYLFIAQDDASLALNGTNNEGQVLASEFLSRLQEIQGIRFSRDIFEDTRFRSLISFTTAPEEVTAGRDNPFDQ